MIDIRGFTDLNNSDASQFTKCTHYEMYSKDFDAKSGAGNYWKAPSVDKSAVLSAGLASTKVKPLSWNVIVFEK